MAFVSIAGCATEPELNDDYATYAVLSDPIPLTPIPGADIAAWAEAIDGLDFGEWLSSGDLVTDQYVPARAEPVEDPRVGGDRLSWVMEGEPPHVDTDFTFNARAVTDVDEGVLSIYCAADYDIHTEYLDEALTSPVFDEVRRNLQSCMTGSGNDAIGPDVLSAWLNEQMDAAEATYAADKSQYRYEASTMLDVANVLVWFDSSERETSVSLSVDPRAEPGPS
ncbi:hypothetical protein [Glycomyces rhizosphaerae]|uniref:Lipoprotein n=1 Tax=Glycomyces rhizosphaerae TaxID=2054422 RepID=A0ABV7PX48_9ACTN